jgi:ketosteroid isomerase-like protein
MLFAAKELPMPNENRIRRGMITRLAARLSILVFAALLLFPIWSLPSSAKPSQSADDAAILTLLNDQTAAWNRGDIEGFMNGYWHSDQTEFVSSEGVSRGWQALLERYRRSYPDRKAMGHLTFSNLEIRVECSTAAYAVGEYHLQRENDNPSGVFTLNFRKFPDGWRIIVDHTTAFVKPVASSK